MRFILLAAIAAFFMVGGISAAAPRAAKHATSSHVEGYVIFTGIAYETDNDQSVTTPANLYSHLDLYLYLCGLEPGTSLETSWYFYPDDGLSGDHSGGGARTANDNGCLNASGESVGTMDRRGVPGSILVRFRQPGTGFDGATVQMDDGPAQFTFRVP